MVAPDDDIVYYQLTIKNYVVGKIISEQQNLIKN